MNADEITAWTSESQVADAIETVVQVDPAAHETLAYEPSFLLSTLRKMLPSENADGEASSSDDNLEARDADKIEAGCVIWDLSADVDAAHFMLEHGLLSLILHPLSRFQSHSPRLLEICAGIGANLASVGMGANSVPCRQQLVEHESACNVLTTLLEHATDARLLHELTRLLLSLLSGTTARCGLTGQRQSDLTASELIDHEDDTSAPPSQKVRWVIALLTPPCLSKLVWILRNTLHVDLMTRVASILLIVVKYEESEDVGELAPASTDPSEECDPEPMNHLIAFGLFEALAEQISAGVQRMAGSSNPAHSENHPAAGEEQELACMASLLHLLDLHIGAFFNMITTAENTQIELQRTRDAIARLSEGQDGGEGRGGGEGDGEGDGEGLDSRRVPRSRRSLEALRAEEAKLAASLANLQEAASQRQENGENEEDRDANIQLPPDHPLYSALTDLLVSAVANSETFSPQSRTCRMDLRMHTVICLATLRGHSMRRPAVVMPLPSPKLLHGALNLLRDTEAIEYRELAGGTIHVTLVHGETSLDSMRESAVRASWWLLHEAASGLDGFALCLRQQQQQAAASYADASTPEEAQSAVFATLLSRASALRKLRALAHKERFASQWDHTLENGGAGDDTLTLVELATQTIEKLRDAANVVVTGGGCLSALGGYAAANGLTAAGNDDEDTTLGMVGGGGTATDFVLRAVKALEEEEVEDEDGGEEEPAGGGWGSEEEEPGFGDGLPKVGEKRSVEEAWASLSDEEEGS